MTPRLLPIVPHTYQGAFPCVPPKIFTLTPLRTQKRENMTTEQVGGRVSPFGLLKQNITDLGGLYGTFISHRSGGWEVQVHGAG